VRIDSHLASVIAAFTASIHPAPRGAGPGSSNGFSPTCTDSTTATARLGTLHQQRTQRIPLDVSEHNAKVFILID
jgi:hypothetical protein